MTAEGIAQEIEHRRFLRYGLSRSVLCEASGVIVEALEKAQQETSRWRFIARAGLALAIQALRLYRSRWCEGDAA
jgi:hypothetical protein